MISNTEVVNMAENDVIIQQIKSLEARMKKVEDALMEDNDTHRQIEREYHETHRKIDTITIQYEHISASLKKLESDVTSLKNKPAERLDKLTTAVIGLILGGAFTLFVNVLMSKGG